MPFTRLAISRTSSPLKIRLSPQEMSEVSMEKSATIATALRPFDGIPASQRMRRLTSGCSRDDVAADDDHHHLHGERNQRPETFAALHRQLAGGFVKQKAEEENDNDAHEGEYQGIGKPALTPVGERQTNPGQTRFRLKTCSLRLACHEVSSEHYAQSELA